MKRPTIIALALMCGFASALAHTDKCANPCADKCQTGCAPVDAPINVMTFNIRLATPADGDYQWENRKDYAVECIRFYQPDLLGMQEVVKTQLDYLKEKLPEFEAVGVGREDGVSGGEHMSLFFRKSRFEPIDTGNFWLSETPDVPSLGWDAACKRVTTWALLRDKMSGDTVLMLNTHLDHIGEQARREGISLILERAPLIAHGAPIIMTGDFNSELDSSVYRHITDTSLPFHLYDSQMLSPVVYGPNWTWHDYHRQPYEKREHIDYVFITDAFAPTRYGVLAEKNGEQFLSDHNPVFVTLVKKAGK